MMETGFEFRTSVHVKSSLIPKVYLIRIDKFNNFNKYFNTTELAKGDSYLRSIWLWKGEWLRLWSRVVARTGASDRTGKRRDWVVEVRSWTKGSHDHRERKKLDDGLDMFWNHIRTDSICDKNYPKWIVGW